MNSLINRDFGRYHIVEQLGEGGMATVYQAFDSRLERLVAIKVINPLQTQSEQFSKRFEREAKALAKLTHPNIVPVIDYGEQDGMLYLVMAYISGGTLRERMGAPLAWQQSARFLAPVAGALDYAHHHGIIHRDVKPANILIMESGQPMLSDFGIAKIMEGQKTQLTGTGIGLGTPDYMAPEQGHGHPVDARSDVYSLGVVYYEMVTGRKPFRADTPLAVLIKHMTEPLPRPAQFVPGLPEKAEGVIFKALAKNPEDRYPDMAAFQAALENLAFGSAAAAAEESAPPASVTETAVLPGRTQTAPLAVEEATRDVSPSPFAVPLPSAAPPSQAPAIAPPPQAFAAGPKRKFPAWLLWVGGLGVLGFFALAAVGLIYLFSNRPASTTPGPTAEEATEAEISPQKTSTSPQVTLTAETAPTENIATLSTDPDRLVVYSNWTLTTLDPAYFVYQIENIFTNNVYETLVFQRVTDTQEFIPQLAESWEISGDGMTYTFKIREGIAFHEGGSLTAEDVAYSFQRNILLGNQNSFILSAPLTGADDITYLVDDTGSLYGSPDQLWQADPQVLLQACETVKAAVSADEDARTVTLRLSQPDFTFLARLATPSSSILDREWSIQQDAWDGSCDSWQYYYAPDSTHTAFFDIANGTGPFYLARWDQAANTVFLERNENYWRREPLWEGAPLGAPAMQSVELRTLVDDGLVETALQSGEADMVLLAPEYGVNRDYRDYSGQECVFDLESAGYDCSPLSDQSLIEYRMLPLANYFALFFTFNIEDPNDGNFFRGSGQLDGDGIPSDFFNDIAIRRGFSACLDDETIIQQTFAGEGYSSADYSTIGMEGYDAGRVGSSFSLDECRDQLAGSSYAGLWDGGFYFQVPTRGGFRIAALENLAQNLLQVNERFRMEILDMENSQFSNYYNAGQVPLYVGGWSADFYDASNMYSSFSFYSQRAQWLEDDQNNINGLLEQAKQEENANVRGQIYRSMAAFLEDNALSQQFMMRAQRIYVQSWVDGFEYNPALYSLYLYPMSEH